MRLESGPATTDRNWQLVRVLLFLGFAVYFVYDGAIGYPAKNREAAEKKLAGEPFNGKVTFDSLGENPDESDIAALAHQPPRTRAELEAVLGKPTYTYTSNNGADEYWLSRYGYLRLTGGSLRSGEGWQKWAKSRAEVRGQYLWAIVPLLPGLYFLWKLYRAVTLRVTLDDQELVYGGQHIPLDQVVALRDYSPKGWIDLYYRAGDRERKLRLDNEKVREFDALVAAVCQVKGFPNEVTDYAARKAREEDERAKDDAAATAAEEAGDERK
jgi:hypothetical protein